VLLLLPVPPVCAGQPARPTVEQRHPSGAFSFRTPAGWRLEALPGRKDAIQASGDEGVVRFLYLAGSNGYDSQHYSCMNERLVDKAATSPALGYEYDSREGPVAGRMALDSAFLVAYPTEVRGQTVWRQRHLTLLGSGDCVCVIVFCPAATWKSSKSVRRTLDGVIASIAFRVEP
jgi:hypothetical protein